MKIGIFPSLREHVIVLSPIYQALIKKGYKTMIFDVEEEKGWFEKGLQYVSLNYDKPSEIIGLKNNLIECFRYFQDLIDRKKLDMIIFTGYTDVLFTLAYAGKSIGVPVIHVGSGLRSYFTIEEEILRQITDHIIPIHFTFLPEHTNNLLKEHFNPHYIHLIGHPLIELIIKVLPDSLNRSTILNEIEVEPKSYIAVFIGKESTLQYIDEVKDFSLNSGEYMIAPLSRSYKKLLMKERKYYEFMNKYDILFLEILDYLDHLNFIFNSKSIITDMEWAALEGMALKKPVVFLKSKSTPLLILKENIVNTVSLDKGISKTISKIYQKTRDIVVEKYYGAGESSQILLESLNNFTNLGIRYPPLELYMKKNTSLIKLDNSYIPKKFREVLEAE